MRSADFSDNAFAVMFTCNNENECFDDHAISLLQ
jgi:hypothetical protein